jgi:hypothetical protein
MRRLFTPGFSYTFYIGGFCKSITKTSSFYKYLILKIGGMPVFKTGGERAMISLRYADRTFIRRCSCRDFRGWFVKAANVYVLTANNFAILNGGAVFIVGASTTYNFQGLIQKVA